MPGLTGPTIPFGLLDRVEAVRQAVKAALEADVNTRVGGNLGILHIVIAKPQLDPNALASYPKAWHPLIEVDATDTGESEEIATHTIMDRIDAQIAIHAQSGDLENLRESIIQIRENVVRMLQSFIGESCNTFIDGANVQNSHEAERPAIETVGGFTMIARAVIPIQVGYVTPLGGVY